MKKKLEVRPYSFGWYLFLVLTAIVLVIVKILLKGKTQQEMCNFLMIFNVIEFIWLRIYKYSLRFVKKYDYNPLNELPFYLCNLATMLCFIAALLKNQAMMAYVGSVGFTGAVLAYMMPDPDFLVVDFVSIKAFGFYGYHGLLMVSCLSFMVLGLHTPDWSYVVPVIIVGVICLFIAHLVNTFLRIKLYKEANYAFTYSPGTNGILKKVHSIIPVRFIYLLPFILPFTISYIIEILIFKFI